MIGTVEERLASRTARTVDADSCWDWTGPTDRYGYGQFWKDRRQTTAHRVAYELAFGAIAPGMCVCHRCDNRRCVRPEHLFLGTHADNAQDKAAKGRSLKGERNPHRKLTDAAVREIRAAIAAGESNAQIAIRHGVTDGAIWFIRKGIAWKHVVDERGAA